jgi:hypothetical protein
MFNKFNLKTNLRALEFVIWAQELELTYFTYLALQPVFGLGLITKVTPFLSIPR